MNRTSPGSETPTETLRSAGQCGKLIRHDHTITSAVSVVRMLAVPCQNGKEQRAVPFGAATSLAASCMSTIVRPHRAVWCTGQSFRTLPTRRIRWVTQLAMCSEVLIALDTEEDRNAAVAQAIAYWLEVLHPRARRWRPYLKDPAQMLEQDMDVRDWMMAGLHG